MNNKVISLVWLLLPITLLIILSVVMLWGGLSFDLIGFKQENNVLYKVVLFLLMLFPLALLPFFSDWKRLKSQEKVLLLGLGAFFVAISHKYNISFLFSIILTIMVAWYLYFSKIVYRPNLLHILLIFYVLTNATSLMWTSDLFTGFRYLKDLSPLLYIPILFWFFKLDRRQFDIVALFVFRAMLFYAVYSICSWALESRFLQFPLEQSYTFGKYSIKDLAPYEVVYAWTNHTHPTYNAVNLIFALSIGWYYVKRSDTEDTISSLELIIFSAITFFLFLLTASRFMLVAWALVSFFGFLYVFRENKRILVGSIIGSFIVMVFAIYSFCDKIGDFIRDPIRISFYKVAFESIEENSWYGVGLGGMTEFINMDNPILKPFGYSSLEEYPHYHPHNQIVGDLMQTGVFGFFLIVSILLLLVYKSLRQRDWLLGINVVMFLLLMCIEMPLLYHNGIFSFALIFSFLSQRNFSKYVMIDFHKKQNMRM